MKSITLLSTLLIGASVLAKITTAFIVPNVVRTTNLLHRTSSHGGRSISISHLQLVAEAADVSTTLLSTTTTVDPSTLWENLDRTFVIPTPLQDIWKDYNVALDAEPLKTKCMTSFVGFIIGDLLAQYGVERTDQYDPIRTLRLASFGILIHGTSGHYFYGFLDTILPGTAGTTVATKVFIDQLFWAPTFTAIFFGYLFVLEGKQWSEYTTKMENDLFSTVRGSWYYWGPAHTINFLFIPPSQRLLYINVLQIIYNIFLSFVGNKKEVTESKESIEK